MIFRTTLTHPILGSIQISPPDGWKESKFKLERHDDFMSLIEYFDGSFIFYGDNGVENGGINFIIQVLDTYGFDAELQILIEISFDDITFPLTFSGLLDLENKEHLPNNKMRVPIIRNDFWSKFISRYNTPVDLKSTVDLDGNAISETGNVTVKLSSQIITYLAEYRGNESFTFPALGSTLAAVTTLGWFNEVRSDINIDGVYLKENDVSSVIPTFFAPWDGEYRIQVKFMFSNYDLGSDSWILPDSSTQFYLSKKGGSLIQLTRTVPLAGNAYIFEFDRVISMNIGESIIIYGDDDPLLDQNFTILGEVRWVFHAPCQVATTEQITLSGLQTIDTYTTIANDRVLAKDQADKSQNGVWVAGAGAWTRAVDFASGNQFTLAAVYVENGDINGDTSWKQTAEVFGVDIDPVTWEFMFNSEERFEPYTGHSVENYIIVTAETVFQENNSESFLIHDAGSGIVNRITGSNSMYSEYLGSTQTLERVYGSDGCAWSYGLLKGLQIRDYSLSEKPFFMSFKKWFDGINPILNIGLGYEEIIGEEVIRIEEKEHFFTDETPVVLFSNVTLISKFDSEFIFNKIEVGYKKWESEDISGIDDPQTKKTYATGLQRSGKPITLQSDFIAASLAIETTRRTTRERSEDHKFDNDVFIIALNPAETSPDGFYEPELDENFDSVTNLNNAETRYNLRLTPARNMLRWLNYLNGCLQKYLTTVYRFVSGEGNYDTTTEMKATDCDENFGGVSLSEKQNISPTTDFLFLPEVYDAEIDMTHEDYVTLVANRKKPIGISQTTTGHKKFHIKNLEYEPFKSKCTMTVWPKDPFTLVVPEGQFIGPCQSPPVTIVSYSGNDTVTNFTGTAFGSLGLPSSLMVQLSDGSTESMNVVWSESSYNSGLIDVQQITGVLLLPSGVTGSPAVTINVSIFPDYIDGGINSQTGCSFVVGPAYVTGIINVSPDVASSWPPGYSVDFYMTDAQNTELPEPTTNEYVFMGSVSAPTGNSFQRNCTTEWEAEFQPLINFSAACDFQPLDWWIYVRMYMKDTEGNLSPVIQADSQILDQ